MDCITNLRSVIIENNQNKSVNMHSSANVYARLIPELNLKFGQ